MRPSLLALALLLPVLASAKPSFKFVAAGDQAPADPREGAPAGRLSAPQFEARARCLIRAYRAPALKPLQGDTLFHTQQAYEANVQAIAENMDALRKYLKEAAPCRELFSKPEDADARAKLEENIRGAEDRLLDQERLRRQYPGRRV